MKLNIDRHEKSTIGYSEYWGTYGVSSL